MAQYALGDAEPIIHPDAFVHPDATVTGNVTLAAGVSVWPQAVLRGDNGAITIGARTVVEDRTLVHCTAGHPTTIGSDCVLGAHVHIESATVGNECHIAAGSVVLNGSVVGDGAVVGEGAVVPSDSVVPPGAMTLGAPAHIRPNYQVPEGSTLATVEKYLANLARYRTELRRVD